MIDTDEALVLRSQQRDRVAFEQLVRRTGRLVYSRIYLDVGDKHRAEDISQETFLIAWKSIAQVSDASGFRPWLLSIAKTATLDAIRRETRKKRSAPGAARLDGEAAGRLADPTPGPSQFAQQSEERQRVLELLRSLPEEYRQPIMLRYLGGADYETIGGQLGLTNGSLRGLLSRGMTKLRESLMKKDDAAK